MFFRVLNKSKDTKARTGKIHTDHGVIDTPAFMPVGTQGTVKTLTPADLEKTGTQMILHNTYHIYLRPGTQLFNDIGGAHKFSKWKGPILTDSGGYQVFSLSNLNKIDENGVVTGHHKCMGIRPKSADKLKALGQILPDFNESAIESVAPKPSEESSESNEIFRSNDEAVLKNR